MTPSSAWELQANKSSLTEQVLCWDLVGKSRKGQVHFYLSFHLSNSGDTPSIHHETLRFQFLAKAKREGMFYITENGHVLIDGFPRLLLFFSPLSST